jgi:hypothetical protein
MVSGEGQAADDKPVVEDQQYDQWGITVRTSNVRPVHIANGIVQLLRLATNPPPWRSIGKPFVARYLDGVHQRFGSWPNLPAPARGLCVTKTKRGPLLLKVPSDQDLPFMAEARTHFAGRLREGVPSPEEQRLLSAVLNADNKVMESGGEDPTTPGLMLAGVTHPQTLSGMHAATFLGLLSATERGAVAVARLYSLLADCSDGHSALIAALGLEQTSDLACWPWPKTVQPSGIRDGYPLPDGSDWLAFAETASSMAENLLEWQAHGASKADTVMAVVDLCALLLVLRLLRWPGPYPGRLLLLVSPVQITSSLRQAIVRAQQSFQSAIAALNATARDQHIIGSPS